MICMVHCSHFLKYIFHESDFRIFLNELLINTLKALINKIIFYNKKMNVFNEYLKGRGHNVFNALLRIFLISLCISKKIKLNYTHVFKKAHRTQ